MLGATDCPSAAPWPPPFRFEYDAHATRGFLGLSGDSTLTLTRDAEGYALVYETKAGVWFTARQSSRGRMGADGVVPIEYFERTGDRPQRTAQLDWARGRVTFSANDKVAPTQPRMQDRLSLILQLGWMLRAKSSSFALPVAGARGASIYEFESRGNETVETRAGRFRTVKIERPQDEDDDRVEIWLAPSLCSLPVKVRFTDRRGMVISNELRAARFTAP